MANSIILVAKEPKIKTKEYGTVYPDGRIEWYNGYGRKDITKVEIRQELIEQYRLDCERLGLKPTRKLIFISRKRIITFTTPEIVEW